METVRKYFRGFDNDLINFNFLSLLIYNKNIEIYKIIQHILDYPFLGSPKAYSNTDGVLHLVLAPFNICNISAGDSSRVDGDGN